jgi:hypothetical protein
MKGKLLNKLTIAFLSIVVILMAFPSGRTADAKDEAFIVSQFQSPKKDGVFKINRPYEPIVVVESEGVSDSVNVTFHMEITDNDGNVVYQEERIIENFGRNESEILVSFPKLIIRNSGQYTAKTWAVNPYDGINNNSEKTVAFEVEKGLSGVITVGKLDSKLSSTQNITNFETVDDLMDALYFEGISADVEFRFTDPEYVLTTNDPVAPAWDMSARIIGVGPTTDPNDEDGVYTIRMRPANNRIAVRGGVKFVMNAESGIGLLFGHNLQPDNQNAVINTFPEREYARSAGYITFDGGSQKCFEFELNTTNNLFGAAVYLQRGSSNITVQNCLITNNSPQIQNSISVPAAKFSQDNGFTYDRNTFRAANNTDVSYSAGILNRSTLLEATEFIGDLRDTLTNFDNKLMNNDISSFALGIMDLGLGILRHNYDPNELDTLKTYYNTNNVISGNRIWDATRAGIFVGYTEDVTVENNLIWDINAPSGNNAIGIEAGGIVSSSAKGYHNVRLSLLDNRITNLNSNTNVTGIRVEQDRTLYETGENPTTFPRVAERTRIANNFIWGLNISNGAASRAGIHLLTERGADLLTPDVKSYSSRADDIVNNTIVIGATGSPNTGLTAGIGVQNTVFTKVINNAISIVDPNITSITPFSASILFQGNMELDNVDIDRNAYWSGFDVGVLDNTNLDLFRYIEEDENDDIITTGYNLEYANLNQIQAATNTQNNSVYGNFVADHEAFQRDAIEPALLSVRVSPAPVNSILNNRGETISWLRDDFDGDRRGAAGQRYDIGADEFFGDLFIFDLSPVTILEPRSYRDITTQFSEAEYIMTEAPVNVVANIRNNGSIQQAGTRVFVRIYRADSLGNFEMDNMPILEKEVEVTIPATDNRTVDFELAEGDILNDWNPMAYDDLIADSIPGYTPNRVPEMFRTMAANVTPRYRIDIVVGSDQENVNNKYSKFVRFYLKKTPRHLLVSSVNTNANPVLDPTQETVGKLNYDAIIEGFNSIGYSVISPSDDPVYDYDIFDRGSWEPRAVDYTMYNFIFYSEGYNVLPTRFEKLDIYHFLDAGSERLKNNIVFSTEEWAALNMDEDFNNILLRADYVNSDPLGTGASYEGNTIIGDNISEDYVIPIEEPMYNDGNGMVTYPSDKPPFPAVVTPRNEGSDFKPLYGLSSSAYLFNLADPLNGQILGTTTITITYNIIHNTVDWRHFGDIETIIRGTIDHLERNDASIVPVELADFNAVQSNQSVVLDWATASESNTSKFIVERADANGNTVASNFASTGLEVDAVGISNEMNYYGPVVDNNVKYGNTYAYRLRVIDFDGSNQAEEQVRFVEVKPEGNFTFNGFSQNPASNNTDLNISNPNSELLTIEVVDMTGSVVLADKFSNSEYQLNVSDLANGAYTVVIRSESGMQTKQLSIVR